MEEIWKDIEDYEGLYQVSDLGRIKSLERDVVYSKNKKPAARCERILKQHLNNAGYLFVTLAKNGINKMLYVHRLTAFAFVPNPDNKPEVNHINSNKLDNRAINLEWNTPSENILHSYKHGFRIAPWQGKFGKDNCFSKQVIQFTKDGKYINEYPSIVDARNVTGVIHQSISSCCNNKRKSAGGFIWKFKI